MGAIYVTYLRDITLGNEITGSRAPIPVLHLLYIYGFPVKYSE